MWLSKNRLSGWIGCALLAAGALAQTPLPGRDLAEFRVTGIVVHALTGQPLGRVHISISYNHSSDVLQSTLSDEGGRFSFQGLKPGKYVLLGQTRGFYEQSLDEHWGFSTAVAVGPRKDSENVVFRMQPDASITGIITDEANEPVRDARAMLFHRGAEAGRNAIHWRQEAQTDDRGRYHFAHVPPGIYFVAVAAQPWYAGIRPDSASQSDDQSLDVAYPVTYFSGAVDWKAGTPITVRPGEEANADVALTPLPTLAVRVTGLNLPANESGLLSVTQKVFNEVPNVTTTQTERLPNGDVEIRGIIAGQYLLNVNTGEPRSQSMTVSGTSEIQAKPAGALSVSGTVHFERGGFPSGMINLTNHAAGISFSGQLSGKGEFQISDPSLIAGRYEVALMQANEAVVASLSVAGARALGRSVQIPAVGQVMLQVVASQGLGVVTGTAMKGDMQLAGAMIVLVPQDMDNNQSLIRRDQSDSDGTFTLPQVLPGNYTVLALQNGWEMEWESASALAPYLKGGTPVNVQANGKYDVQVRAQETRP